jgi:hypothetical protein
MPVVRLPVPTVASSRARNFWMADVREHNGTVPQSNSTKVSKDWTPECRQVWVWLSQSKATKRAVRKVSAVPSYAVILAGAPSYIYCVVGL